MLLTCVLHVKLFSLGTDDLTQPLERNHVQKFLQGDGVVREHGLGLWLRQREHLNTVTDVVAVFKSIC
jgi:hypothetical protein